MIDWPELVWPRNRPQKVYIRFGRWGSRSYNYATRKYERGVSVYPAILDEDSVLLDWTLCEEEAAVLAGRCVFVVTGREVGVGSDGEQLLAAGSMVARPFAVRRDSIHSGFFDTVGHSTRRTDYGAAIQTFVIEPS